MNQNLKSIEHRRLTLKNQRDIELAKEQALNIKSLKDTVQLLIVVFTLIMTVGSLYLKRLNLTDCRSNEIWVGIGIAACAIILATFLTLWVISDIYDLEQYINGFTVSHRKPHYKMFATIFLILGLAYVIAGILVVGSF